MTQALPHPSRSSLEPVPGQNARINLIFVCCGLLLCVYLVLPALHAVQLEGFTAQTESIAMLMSRAPGVAHDPSLPLVSQFIYQTRSAVVDTLGLIYQLFPTAGDRAFQAMVLTSFIALVAASVGFAKRWSNLPTVFPLFALILTQGIPETAFFFNDNIISAALAALALVLLSRDSTPVRWILSGILMGAAILSRVDAVFVMPIVFGIIFYSFPENKKRFSAVIFLSLAAAASLLASAIYHGFSLLDVFFVAKRFVIAVPGSRWLATVIWVRVLFVGLSSLPFLLIGLGLNYQRLRAERSHIGIFTFVVYPALLAAFAPKATEVRYIFPLLAPMIALHVGTGLYWAYNKLSQHSGEKRSRFAIGAAIFALAVAVIPPTQVMMADGPRALFGRLWTPVLWWRWQDSVEESVRRSTALASTLDNQKQNILIATHFNDEFYMRLRLIEAGFVPLATDPDLPGCKGISLLKKGNSVVAHVRTEPQYRIAPVSVDYNAALQILSALNCDKFTRRGKTFISTFGDNKRGMPEEVYGISPRSFNGPLTVQFPDLRTRFSPGRADLVRDYGLIDFRELTDAETALLLRNSRKYLLSHSEVDTVTGKAVTIDNYEAYYRTIEGPTTPVLKTIRERIRAAVGNETAPK